MDYRGRWAVGSEIDCDGYEGQLVDGEPENISLYINYHQYN